MSSTKVPRGDPTLSNTDLKSIASTHSNFSNYVSSKSQQGEDEEEEEEVQEEIVLNETELEELKKSEEYKTGLFGGISVIICVVVGAGIFINPQDTFLQVKSTGISLIIYASLGIHTAIGAICFAELGTTFPVSGGDYAYINEAFGPFMAFQYQQMANLIFVPCVNAILGQTVGRYLLALVCTSIAEGSSPDEFNCGMDPETAKWTEISIGVVFILLATVGNFFNSRYTKKLEEGFLVGKLLGCTLIIVLGFYQMIGSSVSDNYKFELPLDMARRTVKYNCSDDITELPEFGEPELASQQLINTIHALYYGSFSYLGWNYLNFLTKELRNPVRELPLAICISLPLVTVIYVLMNMSYMAILPGREFTCTKAMAYDTLNTVVGVANAKKVGWIATIFVILAALGGLFGHMDASSKLTMAGSQNGHWPSVFQHVHVVQLSPIPSIIFQCVMSLVYCIIVALLHPYTILMSCYCENTLSAVAVYGLIWMRYKRPGLYRPLKLWIGVPIFYCLCATFMFLVPIIDIFNVIAQQNKDDYQSLYLQLFVVGVPTLVFLIGILTYYICIFKQPWPRVLHRTNSFLTHMFKRVWRLKKLE